VRMKDTEKVWMETLKIEAIKREVLKRKKKVKTTEDKQLLMGFPFIPAIMANQYTSISNYPKKPFYL